jgi:hypothetical protein
VANRTAARVGSLLAAAVACGFVAGGVQDRVRTFAHEADEPYVGFSRPDLTLTSGGDAWIAFLAYDGSAEAVLLAPADSPGAVEVVSAGVGTRFPPRVASLAGDELAIVWCERVEGQYDILLRVKDGADLGPIERVSAHAAPDASPALAATATGLWVVWVSARDGQYEVYARERVSGQSAEPAEWSAPFRVSEHPASDVEPSVAVRADGEAWVAWSSWRDGDYASGNYEIYARALTADAKPQRVSTDPGVDVGPSLVAAGSGLAVAWTGATFGSVAVEDLTATAYDAWRDKRFRVSWLGDDGWSAPLDVRRRYAGAKDVHVGDRCEAVSGPDGQLWVFYDEFVAGGVRGKGLREMRMVRVALGESGRPLDLARGHAGTAGALGVEAGGDRLWTAEGMPEDGETPPGIRVVVWSAEGLARITSPVASRVRRTRSEPADEGERATRSDLARGPDERHTVTRGGRATSAWFGNLHMHSTDSRDGIKDDGPPDRNLLAVLDVAALDFACLTDHSGPALRTLAWRAQVRLADLWNRPGRFVVFPGYEWSSPSYGHKNVIFPDAHAAAATSPLAALRTNPTDLWEHLGDVPAITIPHHTSHGSLAPTDWSFRSDERQRLVEIFQKRGNYEHDGARLQKDAIGGWEFFPGHGVRDALADGHRLGIIASPDHGGGLGLAGVWAEELTRESLYRGLHARQTFGTTGAKMSLWLDVEGRPQGSEVACDGPLTLSAEVRGTVAGLRLVLVQDGAEVQEIAVESDRAEHRFTAECATGGSYFYLRVEQADGHIGWTSPIWTMLR